MIAVICGSGFMTDTMSLRRCTLAPGRNHHSTAGRASQASRMKSTEDLILVKYR